MTLDAAAVESYTNGRLDADDADTARQLAAALASARRYCGWHVTPVMTNVSVTLDGSGDRVLVLPTLQLGSVTSITEDGVTLNLSDVQISARGLVIKTNGAFWSDKFGAITVVFTHGYSSAPDFEAVVLGAIDRGAFSTSKIPVAIGPFRYSNSEQAFPGNRTAANGAMFTDSERGVLDFYKLEKRP
jgi:hypothetical protein